MVVNSLIEVRPLHKFGTHHSRYNYIIDYLNEYTLEAVFHKTLLRIHLFVRSFEIKQICRARTISCAISGTKGEV